MARNKRIDIHDAVRAPRLHLTVGITGHRPPRLPDARLEALQVSVGLVLARISETLSAVQRTHSQVLSTQPPCLRLMTALAEGADTLAAHAALQRNWQMDACLPFPAEDYATDFAEGPARACFEHLLTQATSVMSLHGTRDAPSAAYEAVGRVVLDQSDILLALWDGDPARGRGGTAQVVAEAVARHIPVIHIDVSNGRSGIEGAELLWTGLSDLDFEQPALDTVPRAPAAAVLASVVKALTEPPANVIDQLMLRRFLREGVSQRMPALPLPMLLALTGVRGLRRRDLRTPSPEACAQQLGERLAGISDTGRHAQRLHERMLPRYGLADAAGAYFAQLFRSGYIANFSLAAVAVTLALSGLVAPAFKLQLIAGELMVILLILGNTRVGRRAGWHARWLDYRHLAEQLRVASIGSLLGDLGLRDAGTDGGAVPPGWVRWYARATTRELGLPQVVVDQDYLARVRQAALSMIEDQGAYHQSNAGQMHTLDHRLHRLGALLFAATAGACAAWIAAKLLGLGANGGMVDMTITVTVLTAVLPAMGAALYGIRMQGDFNGVAERSKVTATRLATLHRGLIDDPLDFQRLQSRLHRLAEVMLADLSHWRTTYQARPLDLPG